MIHKKLKKLFKKNTKNKVPIVLDELNNSDQVQEVEMVCPFCRHKWRMPDPLPDSVSCPNCRKPITILH
jgi:predicted  nucleic acid-binding Zn ribbon protein